MKRTIRSLAVVAALGLASPLSATQGPSQSGADEGEIVVEGRKERQAQIRRFVGALADTHIRGQLSRFEWAACPIALGMPGNQNARVTERMRRVGQAAGIEMAAPGCDANAIVIVTPDKAATLSWLRDEHPDLFRTGLGERVRFSNPDEPVTAWQVQGRLTQDGLAVPVSQSDMGTFYMTEMTRGSSRISPATRPHFAASVVVIQLDALRGLTTTQLADYAAMRLFASTQPSRLDRSTVPTILSIIDAPMGSEVPVTLTQWDMGYLRALYGSAENRYAEQQRHEMRRLLERDLDRGQASEGE